MITPNTGMMRLALNLSVSPIVMIAAVTQANAQDAAAAPPAGGGVEEIVVTAQRRAENLQDVPISVQAIAEQQISRKVILETRDLASISPTVNYTGGGAFNTAFSLRGISSIALETGIQPSTAMVIDGVPVVRQSEFNSQLADIERVEVLNGPQGTLFGKNSTAGVINIVTKNPTDEYQGLVEGFVTTDEEVTLRGMVNVPVKDAVRLRVNGFYSHLQPLLKNLTGANPYYQNSYGISGKLALDLSDVATLTLASAYSYNRNGFGQNVRAGPSVYDALTKAVTGLPSVRGLTTTNTNTDAKDLAKTWYLRGTLEWKLSDSWSLISISNYTKYEGDSVQDIDLTPAGSNLGRGETIPGSAYPFQYLFARDPAIPDKFNYISQEIRANYQGESTNIIVGGYFQRFKDNYAISLPIYLADFLVGLPGTGAYYQSDDVQATIKDTTASVFGDITQSLTGSIKAFAGLRYTRERAKVQYHRNSFFGPYSAFDPVTGIFGQPAVATYDVASTHTDNKLSGRAGLQYEPDRNVNIYISYSRGYKGPAINVGRSLQVGRDPILKPEIADAVELGSKLRLFNGKVALNTALFYQEIQDIQVSVTEPGNTVTTVLTNAGKIKTRGFEGDAQWAVTPEFRLSGALAYVKATYSGFNYLCNSVQTATGTCPNEGGIGQQDITGQQAIGSPKWKYAITGDYERAFGGGLTFYAQLSWVWNSSIQYQLGDDPITREPSKGLLSASLGLRGPDDRWELQVFGKNLTNKFYYNSLFNVPVDGQPIGFLPRDFHRYVGLKVLARL